MEVRSDRHGLPTKKGTKGICLCKQETHVEDSSRTTVTIFPDAHYHYDRDWRSLNTWKIRGRLKRDVSWVYIKNEGNS